MKIAVNTRPGCKDCEAHVHIIKDLNRQIEELEFQLLPLSAQWTIKMEKFWKGNGK